jgi:hypothetical protein
MAKTAAPRTVTRDEPAARMAPPRVAEDRAPERDPNVIYTRDGKPVDLQRIKNQHDDRFNLAQLGVVAPKGWTYEWRTTKIKGAEATRQIVDDAQRGWTPVPASRHPGKIMPITYDGPIETDGLMLMERDERLTSLSRAHERKAANDQLNISRSMTGLMQRANPNVDMMFDQSDLSAQRGTGVKIERIPMGDPSKKYSYALDE